MYINTYQQLLACRKVQPTVSIPTDTSLWKEYAERDLVNLVASMLGRDAFEVDILEDMLETCP